MSAICEVRSEQAAITHARLMGRAGNNHRLTTVMSRREQHLAGLSEVRKLIGHAEEAGIAVTERLVHQLVFLAQESSSMPRRYDFAQTKWTPWSRMLQDELDSYQGERFAELIRQPFGVRPHLRITPLGHRAGEACGQNEVRLSATWMAALAGRTQNERDLLVSAAKAHQDGLGREAAHARLEEMFGASLLSKAAGSALDEAEELMTNAEINPGELVAV